jgi:hypothetical protein
LSNGDMVEIVTGPVAPSESRLAGSLASSCARERRVGPNGCWCIRHFLKTMNQLRRRLASRPLGERLGHIRKGQGLAVHQADCYHAQRARRADPDRWIELQWAQDAATFFTVAIDVSAVNERGVLGRIAVAIAESDSNILNVHVEDEEARIALIHFKIQVRDRKHLARVMRTLRRVKQVVHIVRPRVGGSRAAIQEAA